MIYYVKNGKLLDKIFNKFHISAMAIYPFILVKENHNIETLNHESIHIEQQKELFLIGFLIWYLFSFIYQFLNRFNYHDSYKNIIFEREAYGEENNLGYLNKRKRFNFLKY
jgi:hypothetical protein